MKKGNERLDPSLVFIFFFFVVPTAVFMLTLCFFLYLKCINENIKKLPVMFAHDEDKCGFFCQGGNEM